MTHAPGCLFETDMHIPGVTESHPASNAPRALGYLSVEILSKKGERKLLENKVI
jgi:hypothetical protein